jgi:ABC-2 type transport system ATP-binding protein
MIEVRNITKRFGSIVAVDDLSFDVKPGRVTGFLGPNGAGKSTTMRCMLGLDVSNDGSARFDGQPYASLRRPLHEVGALLDAGYVHPARTGRNHLRWMALSNGIPESRVDEVLALVGLTEAAKRKVKGYSLGMRQRLGLAGVLLGDPATIILDEPANGLDPEGIRWIRDLLTHFAQAGRTILVSSHLLSEMALIATDLIVVGQGRLLEQCTVAEFVDRHAEKWVRVRSPQIAALGQAVTAAGGRVVHVDEHSVDVHELPISRIGELACEHQFVLHELAQQHDSLEDAFLRATAAAQQFRSSPQAAGVPAQMPAPTSPPVVAVMEEPS